ncbi:phage portal protein family protein [Empedobacter falsenii]
MAKRNRNKTKPTNQQNRAKLSTELVEQYVFQTRQDISKWRIAENAIKAVEFPMSYLLYNLYDDIMNDTTVTSQIENRTLEAISANFNLRPKGGDIDVELTEELQNAEFINEIIRQIVYTRFFGHSVIELDWDNTTGENNLKTTLIPRQNIIAKKGWFHKNYQDAEKINYRELQEYGTWILEFGKNDDLGLLNKIVPHVLFKKFAQSCWSELCEIYGIPPRVMKTDTQDPQALARGKKMMQQMGTAAWFIIDSTEEFQWAQGVQTNGDVYNNLIRLCTNEISIALNGAVLGQDTQNGSYGKERAGQDTLKKLVMADMAMVEMYMNTRVMPALARIGVVPEDYVFQYEIAEDTEELWKMTVQALNHFTVDPEWVKDKFGIKITGERESAMPVQQQNLSADDGFFV